MAKNKVPSESEARVLDRYLRPHKAADVSSFDLIAGVSCASKGWIRQCLVRRHLWKTTLKGLKALERYYDQKDQSDEMQMHD